MAKGAYVYKIPLVIYQNSQLRVDFEMLLYDDTQNPVFANTETGCAFAALGATVGQLGAAVGAAIRSYASQTYGITIAANDVVVVNFARV